MGEGTGYFRDDIAQIVGIPDATWISPDDFTAAYTSARTITLGGGPPAITDDSQLIYVMVVPLVGPARTYVQGVAGVKLMHAAGVITMHNVVDPFTAGDKYRVGIGPKGSVIIHGDINVDSTSVDTSGLIGKPAGNDGDFDVAYTSATEITCSNLPWWYPNLTGLDIETIRQYDGTTGAVINTYSRDDMPMLVTANVITVTGAAFGATDKFMVFTNIDEMNYRLKLLNDFGEVIRACNDHTEFTVLGDASNLADDPNHVTGSSAVLWDKAGGTNVQSGVEDTITAMDLSAFSPNDYVMVSVYIPSLVDVASVGLLLGTDNGNYNHWEWADTELTAGDWNILIAPISEATMLALGWDQGAVTYVALEVIFDAAADTLAGMLVDQIAIISAKSTATTNLIDILAALLLRMPSDGVTHRSPQDFSATYTSSTTLTLAGEPTITNNAQIVKVVQIKADNTSAEWKQGINCTLKYSGGVVTIYGAGTPFVVGDEYAVCLSIQDKAFDSTQDIKKTIDQSPEKDWNTNSVPLVTASDIGAVDGVEIDQGNEISLQGVKQFALLVDFTVNNSLGNEIAVLLKKESGGAEEYDLDLSANRVTLGNANLVRAYLFTTENLFSYAQVRSVAATVGAVEGTLTIDVTKSY